MKCHVALIAIAEVGHGVFGPLIGFGQEHPVSESLVDLPAKVLQKLMRFGKIFAICAFSLVQIRHRVQAHSVHAYTHPELDDRAQAFDDFRAFKIQVRLVVIEAMPVVRARDRIPGPV